MNNYLIGLALAYAIVVIFNFIAISILSDNWKQEIRYCVNPVMLWYCFASLCITLLELRVKVKFDKSKKDPEKAVLPTIIFMNFKNKSFPKIKGITGFAIAVGWWHWSVKFYFSTVDL